MKKLFFALTVFCFLALNETQAQYEEAKNAISLRTTFSNFQYLIDNPGFDADDYTQGLEFTYYRHLNKNFNLAFPLKISRADLPIDKNTFEEDEVIGSLDIIFQAKNLNPDKFFYPYAFGGVGAMYEPGKISPEIPLGIGLNLRITNHFYLSLQSQFRINFTQDYRSQLQHGVGFYAILGKGKPKKPVTNEPVIKDSDNDGLSDLQDECPNQPGSIEMGGCPDSDGDGLSDKVDNCPNEAGSIDLSGCPDNDGDGIANLDDACPDEAGPASGKGCPDADGDGVPNDADKCPSSPGLAIHDGCPDTDGDGVQDLNDECPTLAGSTTLKGCPDGDGDGVADAKDKCPNEAGSVANQGCPELTEEEKEVLTFATQAVQFETGSSRLKAGSSDVLRQVADILKKYPNYNCSIKGYTDSIGSRNTNLELSRKRAKTCYNFIVSEGVEPYRLTYDGFGEADPIANNKYKDGRELNRRVEFDIYLK